MRATKIIPIKPTSDEERHVYHALIANLLFLRRWWVRRGESYMVEVKSEGEGNDRQNSVSHHRVAYQGRRRYGLDL